MVLFFRGGKKAESAFQVFIPVGEFVPARALLPPESGAGPGQRFLEEIRRYLGIEAEG